MKKILVGLLLAALAAASVMAAITVNGPSTTVSYTMPTADAIRLRDALCDKAKADPCDIAAANQALKDLLVQLVRTYELRVAQAATKAAADANTPIDPGN